MLLRLPTSLTLASASALLLVSQPAHASSWVGDSAGTVPAKFPPRLGGNTPWYPAPNVNGIDADVPEGCVVDMAAFVSRHGSRYPDVGAYQQWLNLSQRISADADLTARGKLSFLPQWKPASDGSDSQIALVSRGGTKELYDMGVQASYRYEHLVNASAHSKEDPFVAWANLYPASTRVVDSARLFLRGLLGPNATSHGSVIRVNASDARSRGNSLSPGDLCPLYKDAGGSPFLDEWQHIYLPPITKRLNALVSSSSFAFTDTDTSIVPYLCSFETQILGKTSPWCHVFTAHELKQYEYAQDLRYWYGVGLGSQGKNSTMMLGVLEDIVARFHAGPDRAYTQADGSEWTPAPLIAAFTNDGPVAQFVSQLGVFDDDEDLPAVELAPHRLFHASRFVTMRGTATLERLTCTSKSRGHARSRGSRSASSQYVRVLLNGAVYPVQQCQSGPGKSCPLEEYGRVVAQRRRQAGSFDDACGTESTGDGRNLFAQRTAEFFSDVAP